VDGSAVEGEEGGLKMVFPEKEFDKRLVELGLPRKHSANANLWARWGFAQAEKQFAGKSGNGVASEEMTPAKAGELVSVRHHKFSVKEYEKLMETMHGKYWHNTNAALPETAAEFGFAEAEKSYKAMVELMRLEFKQAEQKRAERDVKLREKIEEDMKFYRPEGKDEFKQGWWNALKWVLSLLDKKESLEEHDAHCEICQETGFAIKKK
jgi:hypothetical protein